MSLPGTSIRTDGRFVTPQILSTDPVTSYTSLVGVNLDATNESSESALASRVNAWMLETCGNLTSLPMPYRFSSRSSPMQRSFTHRLVSRCFIYAPLYPSLYTLTSINSLSDLSLASLTRIQREANRARRTSTRAPSSKKKKHHPRRTETPHASRRQLNEHQLNGPQLKERQLKNKKKKGLVNPKQVPCKRRVPTLHTCELSGGITCIFRSNTHTCESPPPSG